MGDLRNEASRDAFLEANNYPGDSWASFRASFDFVNIRWRFVSVTLGGVSWEEHEHFLNVRGDARYTRNGVSVMRALNS